MSTMKVFGPTWDPLSRNRYATIDARLELVYGRVGVLKLRENREITALDAMFKAAYEQMIVKYLVHSNVELHRFSGSWTRLGVQAYHKRRTVPSGMDSITCMV
jgi:hypothetical protein